MERILKVLSPGIEKYEAKNLPHEQIRSILQNALKKPHQCILALYYRKTVKQAGEGHWSPLAAYDPESDSFLVLDVARYKYPPKWVDATAFIEAMQTSDNDHSRGFILLTRNTPHQ